VSVFDVMSEQLATRTMDGLRRIVHALRVATRASQQTVGLSTAQLFVLRQLDTAPDQSLGDLALRTRTTPSSVSEVVSRLVRLGLVVRTTSERDRRRAVLTLTADGTALVATAGETIQDRLLAGFAKLDAAAQQQLAESLEAWVAASGLAENAAPLFFETTREAPTAAEARSRR
jgi:DNA-binding MarR family transcriptional regulator